MLFLIFLLVAVTARLLHDALCVYKTKVLHGNENSNLALALPMLICIVFVHYFIH